MHFQCIVVEFYPSMLINKGLSLFYVWLKYTFIKLFLFTKVLFIFVANKIIGC